MSGAGAGGGVTLFTNDSGVVPSGSTSGSTSGFSVSSGSKLVAVSFSSDVIVVLFESLYRGARVSLNVVELFTDSVGLGSKLGTLASFVLPVGEAMSNKLRSTFVLSDPVIDLVKFTGIVDCMILVVDVTVVNVTVVDVTVVVYGRVVGSVSVVVSVFPYFLRNNSFLMGQSISSSPLAHSELPSQSQAAGIHPLYPSQLYPVEQCSKQFFVIFKNFRFLTCY